jgi:F-type H+-transporting ATPase subunit b
MAHAAPVIALLLAAGGGGEGGDAPPLPHAEWELPTLIWVWVIFLILLLILWKFAWKPLLAAVEAREKRIADSLRKAEEVQRAAAEIAARQEAALAEAQAKAKAVLDEARAQAEDYRRRETDKARGEADAFLERAKKEIAMEESRARDALRREVVDVALEAAGRVLERSVTSEDEKRLAERLVGEAQAKRLGAGRN